MARVVVVSSVDLSRDVLGNEVTAEDELFVVVPAVEQSRLDWLTNDETDARERAQEIGEAIASAAPAAGSTIEVKPEVPSQAVLDAIAEHDPDRIVLVLRDGGDGTWLEEGELALVPTEIAGVPVTHLRA